jgi:hypothetical protein
MSTNDSTGKAAVARWSFFGGQECIMHLRRRAEVTVQLLARVLDDARRAAQSKRLLIKQKVNCGFVSRHATDHSVATHAQTRSF